MLELVARSLRDAFTLGFGFPLRHLSDVAGRATYSTQVRGAGRVVLRRRSSDASVFRQIFGDRHYDFRHYAQHDRIERAIAKALAEGKTPVVVDGGANVGASAIFFSSAYPRTVVVAVEPDPSNAEACAVNIAGRSNIVLLRAALGAAPGRVTLANPSGQAWAVETRRSDSGEVPVLTVEDVIATVPDAVPVIVKIDIEGFEADLFSNNTGWIDRTTVVIIEPHDWLFPDRKSSRSFQRAMAERDFDLILAGENLVYIRGDA